MCALHIPKICNYEILVTINSMCYVVLTNHDESLILSFR